MKIERTSMWIEFKSIKWKNTNNLRNKYVKTQCENRGEIKYNPFNAFIISVTLVDQSRKGGKSKEKDYTLSTYGKTFFEHYRREGLPRLWKWRCDQRCWLPPCKNYAGGVSQCWWLWWIVVLISETRRRKKSLWPVLVVHKSLLFLLFYFSQFWFLTCLQLRNIMQTVARESIRNIPPHRSCVRSTSAKPYACAAVTRAVSSGDSDSYLILPGRVRQNNTNLDESHVEEIRIHNPLP